MYAWKCILRPAVKDRSHLSFFNLVFGDRASH